MHSVLSGCSVWRVNEMGSPQRRQLAALRASRRASALSSAIAAGYSWYDPDELRHGIEVFLELCREHIQLEESIIYPEAKAMAARLARRRATLPPLKFTTEAPSSS